MWRTSPARSASTEASRRQTRPAKETSDHELTAFVLLAVVVGIGGAVLPGRRAAQLNMLQALHYE